MTKLVLFMLVALALSAVATADSCTTAAHDDKDWTHHHYTVLEIATTNILTPSPLFYGKAPLQNDVWANLLYKKDGTEVVGYDVGLCTLTPPVNNTGAFYNLCNVVHYFNNGTDQVVIIGAINSVAVNSEPLPGAVVGGVGAFRGASGSCTVQASDSDTRILYKCDFWTPKYH